MMKTRIVLALATIFSLPSAATAQFREGEPQVIAPPPQAPDPTIAVLARFRGAYARAGSPRIVIFWNREFNDEVSSQYEDHVNEHEAESTTGNHLDKSTQGPAGQASHGESSQLRERMAETVSGTRRVAVPGRGHMGSEAVDWQRESAFSGALERAGARLADRRMVMRLTGMALDAGERANIQDIETRGLSHYAEIVIEVLQTPDPRAPGGVSYRVTARDLRNARPLAGLLTAGQPRPRLMPYVAGPNGLERAMPPSPGPSQIGTQLAIELLAALTETM